MKKDTEREGKIRKVCKNIQKWIRRETEGKKVQEGQRGGSNEGGTGEPHLHKWLLKSQKGERVEEERKYLSGSLYWW